MSETPTLALESGMKLLSTFLASKGFVASIDRSAVGSGGEFATGKFRNGDWTLELHFRYSLGLVSYALGGSSISHDDYMRQVVPDGGKASYPSFSSSSLNGFEALLSDLENFAGEFVDCQSKGFLQLVSDAEENPRPTGFGAF
jgi:hypothetical protein